MRAGFEITAAILALLLAASTASAKLVFVDADAHPPGADISNVFPELKLTTWYEYQGGSYGKVYSRQAQDPTIPTTGANVFGQGILGTDPQGRPRNETWGYPETMLIIEFYDPANLITLDIIGDNLDQTSDKAAVLVYNADFETIDTGMTQELAYGEIARIEIAQDAFNIIFVTVSGASGPVYIDNLQANIIPEPATLLLLGLGALTLKKSRE